MNQNPTNPTLPTETDGGTKTPTPTSIPDAVSTSIDPEDKSGNGKNNKTKESNSTTIETQSNAVSNNQDIEPKTIPSTTVRTPTASIAAVHNPTNDDLCADVMALATRKQPQPPPKKNTASSSTIPPSPLVQKRMVQKRIVKRRPPTSTFGKKGVDRFGNPVVNPIEMSMTSSSSNGGTAMDKFSFGMPGRMKKKKRNKTSAQQKQCFSDFPKPTAMGLTRLLPLDAFAPIASRLTIRITRGSGLTGNKHFTTSDTTNDTTNDTTSDTTSDEHTVDHRSNKFSCEVRLNGRSLVRSRSQEGRHGDPYWNEVHDVWIDKRINLTTSKLTFWLDYHPLDPTIKRVPLGVVTLQRELMSTIINSNTRSVFCDKSRPLRQYTGTSALGDKTGGSIMVGFSLNQDEHENEARQQTNKSNNSMDALDSTITTEVRGKNKRDQIYGSEKAALLGQTTTGTIGRNELYRLNRLKNLKQKEQLSVLSLMRKLLLENNESNFDGELGGENVIPGLTLPPIAVVFKKKNTEPVNKKKHGKDGIDSSLENTSTFCKIFDQAVARCGIKGTAPPKLIMRSFHGNIRSILLKIHRRSSLEGMTMEFVHRMLNLEESGELIKMVTELEETMNESETTAMCMLIEAIPRHEKKLEIKRPKGKPHNVGPRVRKIKLSKEHEPTKAKKQKKQAVGRNNQAKAQAKASGDSASGGGPKEMVEKTDMAKQEFIDDQGNVYRYVGTVDPQDEGLHEQNPMPNSQRDNDEGNDEDDYDDEEFQANLMAVMKDDSVEPTTKELVELNYVNEHHEQYFQPTLPSEEFSGVMVYNNGVPTQTYNDTEMDPQLMDTLFEFRNRQNNDANLLNLTMRELQTTIPIIEDRSMVNTNATNMKGTHNELYGYNQLPFPVQQQQQQQQQQQMVGANGMNAFMITTANRINHTETSLAAHCFKPPEDHAEFSGVIVYDHGQEIETYENDSYFNPNSQRGTQGGKPTVHVERTIALATLNEKEKKNETNEGYFSQEVMDQHVLPAYMNDVMEMNAGVVPGCPLDNEDEVVVVEEEEEDDPYYGPFG